MASRPTKFAEVLGSDFEIDVDTLRTALLQGASCNIFSGADYNGSYCAYSPVVGRWTCSTAQCVG